LITVEVRHILRLSR